MKIYKFTYDSYKNQIIIYETEIAKETEKMYKINRASGFYESIVRKDIIGQLHNDYSRKMFLLEKNRKAYIEALLERQSIRVKNAKSNYETAKKQYENIKGLN